MKNRRNAIDIIGNIIRNIYLYSLNFIIYRISLYYELTIKPLREISLVIQNGNAPSLTEGGARPPQIRYDFSQLSSDQISIRIFMNHPC